MTTTKRPRNRTAAIQTIDVDPAYLAYLAERARALGIQAVVDESGLSRTSVWAAITDRKPRGKQGQRPSYGVVMRIRDAVLALDPHGPRIPEPFIRVGGPDSASWRAALKGDR